MTNDELKLCRDWATAPNRKWQTLNRSEWKYRFHEKTLVRYVDEASMSESIAALLCAWLCSDDCKSYLQLYGQAVGSEWSPIRAWYEVSNKAVGAVRAVRLYHALSTAVDGVADGPYVVEDGYTYKVSWEYYWKQATVATVPASTSGVSYHIANLSRDPETGLYTYAIEKRERVLYGVVAESASENLYQRSESKTSIERDYVEPEVVFSGGKVERVSSTLQSDGSSSVHRQTDTAKPWKYEYHYTRDDGAVVHIIKYLHQRSIPNYPDGAVGLSINDTEDEYDRHSGHIAYLTNAPIRVSAADFKFVKHGQQVRLYQVRFSRRNRKYQHRVWTVQLHHIRGDAYTDFISDELQANIARTNAGVLAVRLIEKYNDTNGNLLAEWKYVSLYTPPDDTWTDCSSSCKHGTESTDMNLREAVKLLLEGGDAKAAADIGVGELAKAFELQMATARLNY